jgi:hypothetical protein
LRANLEFYVEAAQMKTGADLPLGRRRVRAKPGLATQARCLRRRLHPKAVFCSAKQCVELFQMDLMNREA